jgi:predicted nucleotidyltransferase
MKIIEELKKNDNKAIRQFKKAVLEKFQEAQIILFGSKALGRSDEFSDINLLVLIDGPVSTKIEDEIFELAFKVGLELDVVISVVVESKDFWQASLSRATLFFQNMKEEVKTLNRYRLERAVETYQDAKILFEKGRLRGSVNRIYYSMFYAVNAMLLTKNLFSAKHSRVLALF